MIQLENPDGSGNKPHQSPTKQKAQNPYGQQSSACFGDNITSTAKNERKTQLPMEIDDEEFFTLQGQQQNNPEQ